MTTYRTSELIDLATILVLTTDTQKSSILFSGLTSAGHACLSASNGDEIAQMLAKKPDLALVDGTAFPDEAEIWHWLIPTVGTKSTPLIVLVPLEQLSDWEFNRNIDDFILEPCHKPELQSRIQRLLWKTKKDRQSGTVVCGAMAIDITNCEVVLNNRLVNLTYREFQLLKYLATHPGRVVTREVLLNKVWGYDYFGGDRTVDVHVRRLRSKIEDGTHTFIDTVRNVGYRFRKQQTSHSPE